MKGEFAVKEPSLANYRSIAQKLARKFSECCFEYISRNQNRYVDTLATMASKIEATETQRLTLRVIEYTKACSDDGEPKNDEWQRQIKIKLSRPKMEDLREIQHFVEVDNTLYHKATNGVLARYVNKEEAKEKLKHIHELVCGKEGPKLSQRLQRIGYYWPKIIKEAAELQNSCQNCKFIFDSAESIMVTEISDWRKPYKEYLEHKVLSPERKEVSKLLIHFGKYCTTAGDL